MTTHWHQNNLARANANRAAEPPPTPAARAIPPWHKPAATWHGSRNHANSRVKGDGQIGLEGRPLNIPAYGKIPA